MNVASLRGHLKLLSQAGRLLNFPLSLKTFCEAMKRPGIVRVPLQIGSIDLLCFLQLFLLEQQRAECMPRRLHPAPRFIVVESIVVAHRLAKVFEGHVESAFPIRDLALEHRLGASEDIERSVLK